MCSSLLFLLLVVPIHSKLVALVTLSRHGKRAPNPDVDLLCPRHLINTKSFNVPYRQLTPLGMAEMESLGKHIRDEYVHKRQLLSPSLSTSHGTDKFRPHTFETYMRADAAERCAQSATAMGYGLYPDGTGPDPFTHQPVPVVQETLPNEWMFCAPKNKCKETMNRDIAQYGSTRAKELFAAHRNVLNRLAETCGGISVEQYVTIPGVDDAVLGLKDVVDALIFDHEQDLPRISGSLTKSDLKELRQLQFQMLMERYYGSDQMVTYWASGFPSTLVDNIRTSLNKKHHAEIRYYSYHGHRELLYAMGLLLGWPFAIPDQPVALGQSAIPSATTMFFEIHANDNKRWLECAMWTPDGGREPVKLTKCPSFPCEVDDFIALIEAHISRTGTFEEICAPPTPLNWLLCGSLVLNAILLGWALWTLCAHNLTRGVTCSTGGYSSYQAIA